MNADSTRSRLRIDVVTGSRADYSLILPIARALSRHAAVNSRLVFTGAHFGDNEKAGVDSLMQGCGVAALAVPAEGIGRTEQASAAAMAAMVDGFGRLWGADRPDACVLLGDRFELLPPASVAVLYGIAIAHVFGGEEDVSYCFDTQVRNGITKMAHLHLVMHAAMRKRLLRMGEEGWRICVIGNPALEDRRRDGGAAFRSAAAERGWGSGPYIAACYLPPTAFPGRWREELEALLVALDGFDGHTVIWAGVNADPESPSIEARLQAHRAARRNHVFVASLGATLFESLLEAADAIVGNSSSGLLEAATHGLPNVTVGIRQTGRLTGAEALIVPAEAGAIRHALAAALGDAALRGRVAAAGNPYFRPGAAAAAADFIAAALKSERGALMLKRSLPDNPGDWMGLKRVPEYSPLAECRVPVAE
jgi:UDP-hydrolysing UDP-N-acetyl-D-glucosamine 2-epimerase